MKGRRSPGEEGESTAAALHLNVTADAKKRKTEVEHLKWENTLCIFFWNDKKDTMLLNKFRLFPNTGCTVRAEKSSCIYYKVNSVVLIGQSGIRQFNFEIFFFWGGFAIRGLRRLSLRVNPAARRRPSGTAATSSHRTEAAAAQDGFRLFSDKPQLNHRRAQAMW